MPVTQTPRLYTARLADGGAAVMDVRTGRGRWQHLNSTAALLWHRVTEGTTPEQAAKELTATFTDVGADPDGVRADLDALVGQLRELGLLSGPAAPAPEHDVMQVRRALPADTPLGAADRAAAALALAAALLLLRCAPIRASLAVARAVARLPLRPAGPEQADRLFAAVRRAASAWPGRAACLEESLACYVAAALRGRSVAWVIGARNAPASAHAWNETSGQVIGQDPGDRVWPYAPALRIRHTGRTE
ncbi:lasso peptide biosynthesis B2 protein [Streptomyces sp. SRF1]|uniref:lasso peptide biosynthesis B2 protein n=1 Tax=Streptomyces sp. SRF1 TaxID=1549642 RepID=UPI0025B1C362|nr:lasso peptide biosynthesis B2 protein [Streptomyces sp. SRF1]MDN3060066.1 lasso peptide biosynthesis B2 protein [Streptomyces sp. SRF1]